MSFFNGRTLTRVEAGFRGTSINSPGLKGLGTPLRAGRAGRTTDFIFNRPGSVNSPTARFLICRSMTTDSSSSTAETSFFCSMMCFERSRSEFRFWCISFVSLALCVLVLLFSWQQVWKIFLQPCPFSFLSGLNGSNKCRWSAILRCLAPPQFARLDAA